MSLEVYLSIKGLILDILSIFFQFLYYLIGMEQSSIWKTFLSLFLGFLVESINDPPHFLVFAI